MKMYNNTNNRDKRNGSVTTASARYYHTVFSFVCFVLLFFLFFFLSSFPIFGTILASVSHSDTFPLTRSTTQHPLFSFPDIYKIPQDPKVILLGNTIGELDATSGGCYRIVLQQTRVIIQGGQTK